MRTKLTRWYDPDRDIVYYGIQVLHEGKWTNVAIDGKAALFEDKNQAEQARALLRKMKPNDPTIKVAQCKT